MSQENEEAVGSIAQSIAKAIEGVKDELSYDYSLRGEITSIEANDKYGVSIDGKIYILYSSIPYSYAIHDLVWVTVPRGVFRSKFISGRRFN